MLLHLSQRGFLLIQMSRKECLKKKKLEKIEKIVSWEEKLTRDAKNVAVVTSLIVCPIDYNSTII